MSNKKIKLTHKDNSDLNKNKNFNLLIEETKRLIKVFNSKKSQRFYQTPDYLKNCILRDYQIDGLNRLINWYENNVNGILADEMGLGKTIQTISFLGYLKHIKKIVEPFLVIVPKSVLNNWSDEFQKWCPSIKTMIFMGDKKTRYSLKTNLFSSPRQWDACLTTYDIVSLECTTFQKYIWHYMIIDEGHRVKNDKSKISILLREIKSLKRLLITGTPLQNSLQELWSLLNFLLPQYFNSYDEFQVWFDMTSSTNSSVEQLHVILKPLILRRLKADVEKELKPKKELNIFVNQSKTQNELYKQILLKDVKLGSELRVGKLVLNNLMMQLKKCANHPYLFHGIEKPPYLTDIDLITNSGKLLVLDKLLQRLYKEKCRILIFSQMVRMLDILDDYLTYRNFKYCRFDGSSDLLVRDKQIEEFNADGSEKFIFLLSTRAGGLGINLSTADVVIIYDSDWNPQVDLQAIDRAHRIGQKKQVRVFRLITRNTIEEHILSTAEKKRQLEKIVIQDSLNDIFDKENVKFIENHIKYYLSEKQFDSIDEDIDLILSGTEVGVAKNNKNNNYLKSQNKI